MEEPATRNSIIAKYKLLEADVFTTLYGKGFRHLTVRELIELSETAPSNNIVEILSGLENSIALRRQADMLHATPCLRHKYFNWALNCIVDNLKTANQGRRDGGNPSPHQEFPSDVALECSQVENKVKTAERKPLRMAAFSDLTIDENDFLLFLDGIQEMVMAICELFQKASDEDLAAVSLGSDYMFDELKSNIAYGSLIWPHWFERDGSLKHLAHHTFLEDLRKCDETSNYHFWKELLVGLSIFSSGEAYQSHSQSAAVGAAPELAPRPIIEMAQCMTKDTQLLYAHVVRYVVSATRNRVTSDLRKSTIRLCSYTEKCITRFSGFSNISQTPDFNFSILEWKANLCPDVLSLAFLYAKAVGTLTVLFRILLDQPLILALVHLYLQRRICYNIEQITELEGFCNDPAIAPTLFWNGRPRTKESLDQSVTEWVAGLNPRSENISMGRYRNSILVAMNEEDLTLNHAMARLLRKRDGWPIWKVAVEELKSEMLILDVAKMWESVLDSVRVVERDASKTDEDASTVLFTLILGQRPKSIKKQDERDKKVEKLLKFFEWRWEHLRRESPMPGEKRRDVK